MRRARLVMLVPALKLAQELASELLPGRFPIATLIANQ
jgi:hypothetical protein